MEEISQDEREKIREEERRVINPSLRFGYVDMVAFALNVVEEIENDEPRNYVEAIKSN